MTEAIPAAAIGLPTEGTLPPATMAVSIDFSRFSFVDLAVLAENMKLLGDTASCLCNQPRCAGEAPFELSPAGALIDVLGEAIYGIRDSVVRELEGRTPATKSEQNIRDHFLLIEGLSYMDEMEATFANAFQRIGRKVVVS